MKYMSRLKKKTIYIPTPFRIRFNYHRVSAVEHLKFDSEMANAHLPPAPLANCNNLQRAFQFNPSLVFKTKHTEPYIVVSFASECVDLFRAVINNSFVSFLYEN